MNVFERAARPRDSTATSAKWLTWSRPLRNFVGEHERALRSLAAPHLIDVKGCEPYESTYDIAYDRLEAAMPVRRLMAFGKSLYETNPRESLMLFDGLIDESIDSDLLYAVFVALRAAIVRLTNDSTKALMTPVKTTRKDHGFPLHSDLFMNRRLFIAFDDVTRGGDGASLFLRTKVLLRLLERVEACRPAMRRRVRALLQSRLEKDSFDELFDLLHGAHPWVGALGALMEKRTAVIRLKRGQGYLIDDREWLHGRTASRIPVRTGRFRRLVF